MEDEGKKKDEGRGERGYLCSRAKRRGGDARAPSPVGGAPNPAGQTPTRYLPTKTPASAPASETVA